MHLETIGKPSHSSSPQLGHNAVLDMMTVVAAIEDIALPEHPLMGPAILALTDIISEPYPGYSVIPSLCKTTYDRRLLPGETKEDVLNGVLQLPGVQGIKLNAKIAQGEHAAYTSATLRSEKFFPAWLYPQEHPFVQSALNGLHAAGLKPQTRAYRFCTNAAYSAGVAGVPTVGFGPAEEGDAHVINERLKLDELKAAARGYKGIIEATMG
ncbi:MAG: M20/M25/M40 family metallo-hydrolase [Caldilineaceae bacterium]